MRYLESVGVLTGQFEEQLGELKTGRSRTLNVGMTLWRGSVLLPDILPSYSESHPDVRITLREHHTAQLSKLLQEDQIDFALMNMPLNLDDFVYDTIFNERLLLVASKDHPAIRGLEAGTPDHPLPIDMKKLRRERFILLQEDQVMGHAMKNLFAKMNWSQRMPYTPPAVRLRSTWRQEDSASPSSRKAESATLPTWSSLHSSP